MQVHSATATYTRIRGTSAASKVSAEQYGMRPESHLHQRAGKRSKQVVAPGQKVCIRQGTRYQGAEQPPERARCARDRDLQAQRPTMMSAHAYYHQCIGPRKRVVFKADKRSNVHGMALIGQRTSPAEAMAI